MEKYLRDGLRLGFGMGLKSALAGLWYVCLFVFLYSQIKYGTFVGSVGFILK